MTNRLEVKVMRSC